MVGMVNLVVETAKLRLGEHLEQLMHKIHSGFSAFRPKLVLKGNNYNRVRGEKTVQIWPPKTVLTRKVGCAFIAMIQSISGRKIF